MSFLLKKNPPTTRTVKTATHRYISRCPSPGCLVCHILEDMLMCTMWRIDWKMRSKCSLAYMLTFKGFWLQFNRSSFVYTREECLFAGGNVHHIWQMTIGRTGWSIPSDSWRHCPIFPHWHRPAWQSRHSLIQTSVAVTTLMLQAGVADMIVTDTGRCGCHDPH